MILGAAMASGHHDDDDLYNQTVLAHIAAVVRQAEEDAEDGIREMQRLTDQYTLLSSSVNAALRHLEGTCMCQSWAVCRRTVAELLKDGFPRKG